MRNTCKHTREYATSSLIIGCAGGEYEKRERRGVNFRKPRLSLFSKKRSHLRELARPFQDVSVVSVWQCN